MTCNSQNVFTRLSTTSTSMLCQGGLLVPLQNPAKNTIRDRPASQTSPKSAKSRHSKPPCEIGIRDPPASPLRCLNQISHANCVQPLFWRLPEGYIFAPRRHYFFIGDDVPKSIPLLSTALLSLAGACGQMLYFAENFEGAPQRNITFQNL